MLKGPKRDFPLKIKKSREAHVANTPYGMGDHYGTGIRQPLAKMRDGMGMKEITSKKMKTPPRSVV